MKGWQNKMGWLVMAVALSSTGCDPQAVQPAAKVEPVSREPVIHGSVSYRERIVLAPGAELTVTLEDVSRADTASEVIARLSQPLSGTPPYPFVLPYDPAKISSQARYSVRARITQGDKLLFTSTEQYQPFGVASVDILLRRVDRAPAPTADSRVAGEWLLIALDGKTIAAATDDTGLSLNLMTSGEANGFSGCNQFRSQYTLSESATGQSILEFGPVAGTRKMCEKAMALETTMLAALKRSRFFQASEHTLTLKDSNGAELARFRRRGM